MVGGLALIVIVAIAVFGVSMARHQPQRAERGSRAVGRRWTPQPAALSHEVNDVLERAVNRGQITRETADAILSSEASEAVSLRSTLGAHRERVVASPTVEAIGYVGSILALVGVGFFVGRAWDDIGQPGRIGMLAGLAAFLLMVGLLLHNEEEAVIWRLRNFVLLLSTGALAGCTGVVLVDTFDWRGESVAISIGLVATVYSAALWMLQDRPAQQLSTFVGMLVASGAAMSWWGHAGALGLTVLGLGAAWTFLGALGLLPPRPVALVLGLAATLLGPSFTDQSFGRWSPVIGLVVATLLLGIGGVSREFAFTGFGVIGLLAYLTYGVARWFGDSLKAPGVLVVAGFALLIATVILIRRGRGGHRTPARRHHTGPHPAT